LRGCLFSPFPVFFGHLPWLVQFQLPANPWAERNKQGEINPLEALTDLHLPTCVSPTDRVTRLTDIIRDGAVMLVQIRKCSQPSNLNRSEARLAAPRSARR
jgi:hypothetical protein